MFNKRKIKELEAKIEELENEIEKKKRTIYEYSRTEKNVSETNKNLSSSLETEYLIQRDLINADFLKDYIHKDKIKKLLETYDKNIAWANADDHYYFVKFINEILDE